MTKKELEKIRKRIVLLQGKMAKLGPVMRGSIVVIGKKNKQPYFSFNKNKKTRMIYLGKEREVEARKYVENHRKLKDFVDEITELNMILLKKRYEV